MQRNLHRRVEVAFPVYTERIKREIINILKIQLADNQSAVWVDENLCNRSSVMKNGTMSYPCAPSRRCTTT